MNRFSLPNLGIGLGLVEGLRGRDPGTDNVLDMLLF